MSKTYTKDEMMAIIAQQAQAIETLKAQVTAKAAEKTVRNPVVADGKFKVIVTVNTNDELVLQWYDAEKEHHKGARVYTRVADVYKALQAAREKTGYAINKYAIYVQKGYKASDDGMVMEMRNAWKKPQVYFHTEVTTTKQAKGKHVWETF